MEDPLPSRQCPHCESTDIAWTEPDNLDRLTARATSVKCGACGKVYSVEYEISAISYYDEETDDWTTHPIN